MAAVEGRYTGLVEPLGDCDDTGVGTAEGKVDVLFDEIGDTVQIGPGQRLDHHIALRDRSEERRFCSGPELSCNQVRGLGDDEMARDKLIGRLNDFDAGDVVGVSVVRCGEKDSGVNNEHDQSRPNPSANISSASRAPRPDVDEPIPTNASLRRGRGPVGEAGSDLGDELVKGDPAAVRFGLEAGLGLGGKIKRHGHGSHVRAQR